MSIRAFLPESARRGVAWIDADVPADAGQALQSRLHSPRREASAVLSKPDEFAALRAVVIQQDANKLLQFRDYFDSGLVALALDSGTQVLFRLATHSNVTRAWAEDQLASYHLPLGVPAANATPPPPNIEILDVGVAWADVGNDLLRNPADPPASPRSALTLTIEDRHGKPVELRERQEILFRRAFHDCVTVHLRPMDDEGNSGAQVYRVFAKRMVTGKPRSISFFAKLGKRTVIVKEYHNYQQFVESVVPFHLGPSLQSQRCLLGARCGLIVGDLVEESESLAACVRSGRATSAISCLFTKTLRGWNRDALVGQQPITHQFPRRRKFHASVQTAATQLGATLSYDDLIPLVDKCPTEPFPLVARTHGDLHAKNVMVRGNDAIVIDFAANDERPILFDVAVLEASLLVDGFPDVPAGERVSERFKSELRSLASLYDGNPLQHGLPIGDVSDPVEWYYRAIHQVRVYARSMDRSRGEHYAVRLADALLFKAAKGTKGLTESRVWRMGAAYWFAELVLKNTFP